MVQMKAARWYGQKDIRVEEVEVPKVGAKQVKIAIKYTGICGSDLHEYLAGPIFIPANTPHPLSGVKAPLTLGHEFSGEVVEVGEEVKNVNVGDRVTVEPIIAENGLIGDYNLDPYLNFVGLAADGGFAEFCVCDAELAHIIPDSLSYEQAALTEPSAVALYAVRQSAFKAGDTAAVFGCGPIGLLVIEALKAAGATKIYAIELSPERQAKAEELGAIVVRPKENEEMVEAIYSLTNGGVDVSYEVTGVPIVLKQALESVHKGGECMVVSIFEKEASIQPNVLVTGEKTMKGTIAYRHIFPNVLELMEKGYFSADKIVTKKIILDDIVANGFEELSKDKSQVKILVSPK
ncbi:2,3-butanediol dehydrogenase [Facklamia miroungae]|uniref:(R,R)-butanediol dehydrogenase / meso-butanediol dehydrogenase / diacetyl reductase n=1 Tax=Facklamia miroungae TaxID=120956 RepID=A0A1G7UP11_9LACT|nr:2,3-butanediol dehydrogenase [Facklamia miroungae]NKZ30176.1 2,3-butanediol dehydrogenase [Facklamia miroungae]SDG49335.1 (R,R)-butanediol dehydrogenase / meso-butanediol dehydrogenase / diacetyl reductase [Facklamia miroungae]